MKKHKSRISLILTAVTAVALSLLCIFAATSGVSAAGLQDITDEASGITLSDTDANGYYEIWTEKHLYAFESLVNGGEREINAELYADIEATSTWTPIGDGYRSYNGSFDGRGHTLTNVYYNNTAAGVKYGGIFGYLGKTGTVKNLSVNDSSISANKYVGAIVGYNEGTVENCFSNATVYAVSNSGGIVGYNRGYVKSCLFTGEVTGYYTQYTGGVVGENDPATEGAVIINSYAVSADNYANVVGSNSYDATEIDSSRTVSTSELSSGIVAYLLGEGSGGAWGQMIGTDPTPTLGGRAVYYHEAERIYSNYVAAELSSDGYYEIGNADQLMWLAKWYNDGRLGSQTKARLTANIDLSPYVFTPIGTSARPFAGIFDGAGYAISGFRQTVSGGGHFGLFGYATGDTTVIGGFSLSGEVTTALTANSDINYGVVGEADGKATIENVHSTVNLTATDSYMKKYVGGIVGRTGNVTVKGSSFGGTLDLGASTLDCVGGIVGYSYNGKTVNISDCSYYGTVISEYSGGNIGGIIGYYNGENAKALSLNTSIAAGTLPEGREAFVGKLNNYGSTAVGSGSYMLSGLTSTVSGVSYESVSAEALTSGSLAYTLGAEWGQNIDNSLANTGCPIYGAARVYYGYTTCHSDEMDKVFTNLATASAEKPTHTAGTDANCTTGAICGTCSEEYTAKNPENHANNTSTRCEYLDAYTHALICSECGGNAEVQYHTEGKAANCTTGAVCRDCKTEYTEKNPDNHEKNTNLNSYIPNSDGTHSRLCSECNEAIVYDGHTSSTAANCKNGMICEVCGFEYTVKDPTNHANNTATRPTPNPDGETHSLICTECNVELSHGEHTGGTASCASPKICTDCGAGYGERPSHDFTNSHGFCRVCDMYEAAALTTDKHDINGDGEKDAVYEISNAGQLFWFAELVNNGYDGTPKNSAANAILTGDIVIATDVIHEDGTLAEAPERTWTQIGLHNTPYLGTFDGGGFVISGVYIPTANNYQGLFGYVYRGGIVRNVILIDSYINGATLVGGIAGYVDGGTVENCLNYATVCGYNRVGGIVGELAGSTDYPASVTSSLNLGMILPSVGNNPKTLGAIVGVSTGGTVERCYYLSTTHTGGVGQGATGATSATPDELMSGKIAYLLSGDDGVWGQEISSDLFPMLFGKRVYYGYTSCADGAEAIYTNSPDVSAEKPEHTDANKDHTCDNGCGKSDVGTHADSDDNDHTCDYGCGFAFSDCSDSSGDGDHLCDVCGKADVTSHNYGNATCDEPATCLECGTASGGAIGHDYERNVTKEPSCTETGTAVYVCSRDASHTYTEEIPATGHSFGEWQTVTEPTSTEDGKRERSCACGYVEAERIPAHEPKGGLPGGAIAAIAVGSAILLGIAGFAVYWFIIRKKTWGDFILLFKKDK